MVGAVVAAAVNARVLAARKKRAVAWMCVFANASRSPNANANVKLNVTWKKNAKNVARATDDAGLKEHKKNAGVSFFIAKNFLKTPQKGFLCGFGRSGDDGGGYGVGKDALVFRGFKEFFLVRV